MIIAMPTISIESGHVWSDLTSRSYSETLSLQLQRCGAAAPSASERAFDRCPGIGVARSLARSIVSSVAKNVRTTEERPAEGEEENDGRPRDETKAKAAGAVQGRGRDEGLQTAGGRAGGRSSGEREREEGRGASPSSPFSREGTD